MPRSTALRAAGYRVSTTRRLMLEALYSHDEPLTAEQVARRIGGETGGDVASVYRNLETLERLGLVRHFHLGHSPGLYVRAGAGVSEYLVCASCQAVRAVDPDSAGRRPRRRSRAPSAGRRASPTTRSWACAPTAGPPARARWGGARDELRVAVRAGRGPRRLAHRPTSTARRCSWRSGWPSCSGCATPPTPTTSWRSPRSWPPTTATRGRPARLGAWWGLGHATVLLVDRDPADRLPVVSARVAGGRRRRRPWAW